LGWTDDGDEINFIISRQNGKEKAVLKIVGSIVSVFITDGSVKEQFTTNNRKK